MADATERTPPRLPKLEPGETFAGYRIEGVLDRGGMGVLYKATDPALDRTVALKIIAPEHTQNETAVARFKAEARLAASLEHQNIVPIHRAGEEAGVLYLAMRYVPGTNLRQVIDRGPMDLRRVAPDHRPRSPTRSTPRTRRASSTATSSPRTSSSAATATRSTSTSPTSG